jgi:hypothetical protein
MLDGFLVWEIAHQQKSSPRELNIQTVAICYREPGYSSIASYVCWWSCRFLSTTCNYSLSLVTINSLCNSIACG